mmetsp:Transcript_58612/g.110272  ORF Transcript_58612/g.110272 Transcript_58612/m.110272 type:complete len:1076 (+) Transcript_58612:92-3319(+)
MKKIALALSWLACLGHGRRVQTFMEQPQSILLQSHEPSSAFNPSSPGVRFPQDLAAVNSGLAKASPTVNSGLARAFPTGGHISATSAPAASALHDRLVRSVPVATMSAEAWPAAKVRETFTSYFGDKHNHTQWPSSPVVPLDDPTLLFANAGMNQFKPIFVGQAQPGTAMAELKRAANSQKCIRAGGKHNDLDDVGMDTYHHTFFEMLGSWSFGDYFKEEAIDWAWDLLTKVYGLPEDRFYATYFEGDEKLGLAADEEARQLWLRYLPESHVLPGNAKDNFWEMGDTGPCGPCSELHYDRIGGRNAASLVNQDDPDVLEVWNLVFMQFNREAGGELRPLPAKSVDTGMGFERLVSVLQDKRSNYDTDVFMPIFSEIQRITGSPAYTGKLGAEDEGMRDTAYRVVADHIRTLSLSIADGAVVSNVGRGYVLRRILRRAIRYGQQMLGGEKGFFTALVPSVVSTLGDAFPELKTQQAKIQEVIAEEEDAFASMLSRGIKEFNKRTAAIKAEGKSEFDGDSAFFLYDSMGFPMDLTELMAKEEDLSLDVAGFEAAMEEQKQRSKADQKASGGSGGSLDLGPEEVAWITDKGVAITDDSQKFIPDVTPVGKIQAIYNGAIGADGFIDESSDLADAVGIVLDQTSFFAEAGGQVADVGSLVSADGSVSFEVTSVQSFGGFVLHRGTLKSGKLETGMELKCDVDYSRRLDISRSHTVTHVINLALHQVLGDTVAQRGSLVDEHKARFDFSHGKALTPKQMKEVEEKVQATVKSALKVDEQLVPLDKAMEINNLRAVFGESYPDPVRVISIGPTVNELVEDPSNAEWEKYSIELCGGTHTPTTDVLSDFALVEESSVAKGVRRVVGLTGEAAASVRAKGEALNGKLATLQKTEVGKLADTAAVDDVKKQLTELKVEIDETTISAHVKAAMRDDISSLDKKFSKRVKELNKAAESEAAAAATTLAEEAVAAGKKYVVLEMVPGMNTKAMAGTLDEVKKLGIAGIALSADQGAGKVACSAIVPEELVGTLPANSWLQAVLKEVDGRGGGRPGMAQGTGTAVDKLPLAIEKAGQFADEALAVAAA